MTLTRVTSPNAADQFRMQVPRQQHSAGKLACLARRFARLFDEPGRACCFWLFSLVINVAFSITSPAYENTLDIVDLDGSRMILQNTAISMQFLERDERTMMSDIRARATVALRLGLGYAKPFR